MENFIVNQINPNFNNFYERKQAQPQFRSNFATPQEEQILAQNTELPEIYKIDIDAQEKEKQTLAEKVKKFDMFQMITPWVENPFITAGTTAVSIYGIDKFNAAWSGEYEKSLLGKATKLGDDITNAKFFKKEPVAKFLGFVKKYYNKAKTAINDTYIVKAVRKTPCVPEWPMGKGEFISQENRIISDTFGKIVDCLKLDKDGAVQLKELGLKKKEYDFLKSFFGVSSLKNIPEDKAVNAILMKRLGKSDADVRRFAEMGKSGIESVKEEIRNFLGLTVDKITAIKTSETNEFVNEVLQIAEKGKGRIWAGGGEYPILGKFQPLKRTIGFDQLYNRLYSLGDGAKTALGKSFSKFIQTVYRGFTFGGGKLGMMLFIVPHFVSTVKNTTKDE